MGGMRSARDCEAAVAAAAMAAMAVALPLIQVD